ncbi:MAG: protein serine/threonine phosphatase 2C family protein [Bacteroidales bacterium]|nr:protein serine/threonine phosphatase 2C family protein [Bacteroidales bacterium]
MIDVEVFSKPGVGKYNEDYVLHTEIEPDISLIVICDGMGGLSYGADASKIIAHSIDNYLRQALCSDSPKQPVIDAIHYANNELAKECSRLNSKMGASVALTLFLDNTCYYTWLGDVRIYLATRGKTELLTKDHLAIEGNHSFLSRCINGKEFRHSPEVRELEISSGDELYIATDGYYLHNKIVSPSESAIIADDDATIVYIKLK